MKPGLVATLMILAPIVFSASVGEAAAQPPLKRKELPRTEQRHGWGPHGSELFRGLLNYHKIHPYPNNNLERAKSEEGLIIIIFGRPEKEKLKTDIAELAVRALSHGGALLIASDTPIDFDEYFPNGSSLSITREKVFCTDENHRLGGIPEHLAESFPYVVPIQDEQSQSESWRRNNRSQILGREFSVFANLSKIATDSPASLSVDGPTDRYFESRLAGYPRGCHVGSAKGPPLKKRRWFGLGGTKSNGKLESKCLILADQGVFSNQLISYASGDSPATDNFLFAVNVVKWLSANPGGEPRTMCLFVDHDHILNHFDDIRYAPQHTPIPTPPIPNPLDRKIQEKATDAMNHLLRSAEERDSATKMLTGDPPDEHKQVAAVRSLMLAAMAALSFLAFRFFLRIRHQPDLPPSPRDAILADQADSAGPFERRKTEILRSGDYAMVVRDYIRELFLSRGLPQSRFEGQPGPMPPVQTSGPNTGAVRESLRILWDVAFPRENWSMPYSRWKDLEPVLNSVRRAADADQWRFVITGENE